MKKRTFDIIFIVLAALGLTLIIEFDLVEGYFGYALIPLMAAYQIGQYSERRFKK